MKSERRHELEKNELADWLASSVEAIRPYQNAILGVVILIAAAVVAFAVWRNMAQRQATVAWDDYFHAIQTREPRELEDVVNRHAGSRVAHWAATSAADLRLAAGCDLLFEDKPSALYELRNAVDLYLMVLEQSREQALLERATFGLARAYEAQIDLDQAMEHYAEVVERWPDGPFAEVAGDRLAALRQRSVRELADRFAKWEPEPRPSDLPDFPASRPEFDLDALPDGPVFTPGADFGLEGLDDAPPAEVPEGEPLVPGLEFPLDEPDESPHGAPEP